MTSAWASGSAIAMAQPLIAKLAKCGPSHVSAGLGLETSWLGSWLKPKLSQAGRNTRQGAHGKGVYEEGVVKGCMGKEYMGKG